MVWAPRHTLCCALLTATAAAAAGGCQSYPYDPEKATRPYPVRLTQSDVIKVQVIPDLDTGNITVVNATATSYTNFDLWLNRRYMKHVESLKSGETLQLDIETFWDERGEGPFPGGWFRYFDPTPVVLAQMQLAPDKPLIGLECVPPNTDRR